MICTNTMSDKVKYISFGGLGDSYIVFLKLREKLLDGEKIDWLHIESNDIVPTCINDYIYLFRFIFPELTEENFIVLAYKIENYQQAFRANMWPSRFPINTSVLGKYHYPGPDSGLMNGIVKNPFEQKYDVCIQTSAGAKSNRKWNFDILTFIKFLRAKGLKVAVVGSDIKYKTVTHPDDFVCVDLSQAIQATLRSKVYIGLSGFLTYLSLSNGVNNIHLEESAEHNKHYIHPDWEKYRYGINVGSMSAIIGGLRHYGINI